jgi:uncharacterized OB-fold protein
MGAARNRFGDGHGARLSSKKKRRTTPMALHGDHLGMSLSVNDLDTENLAYFGHCAAHNFHLQQCGACRLLRYPPTTACPFCGHPESTWVPVEGKGTVHSYTEIHHAIQQAFKAVTPYMLLIVELDIQQNKPNPHDAIRVAGNLVTPAGDFAPPDLVKRVGIGSRMRMVFKDVSEGLSLPMWTLDEAAPATGQVWRYPQE